jgi:HSP20 family molecular chaperone IbpA
MNGEPRLIRVTVGPFPTDVRFAAQAAEPRPDTLTPPIDIHEGPEGLVLEADVPGVEDKSLTVQLEDNVLSLHAVLGPGQPEGSRVLHEEFRVAAFARSFILSDEVDRARIAAELRHGVLRVVLPRAERPPTRRIEVKAP